MDDEGLQLPGVREEQRGLPPVVLTAPPSEKLKRTPHESEDASDLGPEFSDPVAGTLSISEVKILLEQQEQQERKGGDTRIRQQTYEYCTAFARFSSLQSIREVRDILRRDSTLTQFEIAQIANLCPAGAEEAKALIPTMREKDDDLLEGMMEEIKGLRKVN
ncbi:hypothetical protein BT69DRAFT_1347652 [Atractiella rhizophila]|nr:hypothetical protein BT69DRAFT_1359138 [Atractiella rhizophila]KAH8926969.1 hypothetical protein BT69DRAFT_1347652 [Atractiella rhizophila]